jgi:hypothetical protein
MRMRSLFGFGALFFLVGVMHGCGGHAETPDSPLAAVASEHIVAVEKPPTTAQAQQATTIKGDSAELGAEPVNWLRRINALNQAARQDDPDPDIIPPLDSSAGRARLNFLYADPEQQGATYRAILWQFKLRAHDPARVRAYLAYQIRSLDARIAAIPKDKPDTMSPEDWEPIQMLLGVWPKLRGYYVQAAQEAGVQ